MRALDWLPGLHLRPSWQVRALKTLFDVQLGKMLQPEPATKHDLLVPYLKAAHVQWDGVRLGDLPEMWADADDVHKYRVYDGDLLVCEGGEVGRAATLRGLDRTCIIQNALHRVRARSESDTRFLKYVLEHLAHSGWFDVLCNRATIAHLTGEKLAATRVPAPAPAEQRAIADFLDRKTAAIDALIEKKERFLALLDQQRQGLVTRAVTLGLCPGVTTRGSGVPWLTRIPSHWKVHRLKYVSMQVTVGIVVTPSKYYADEGVPALRSFNVRPGALDPVELAFISPEANLLHRKSMLHEGDLVAVRTGQPGTTAVVDARFEGANCIDLIIIRRSSSLDSRFLCYFMNSGPAHHQYGEGVEGALQQHFNVETARGMCVPVPPVEEQRAIADHLDSLLGRFDAMTRRISEHVASLREYRQALITAAVTGQLDVTSKEAA